MLIGLINFMLKLFLVIFPKIKRCIYRD